MPEKFYLPEEKTNFTVEHAEQANTSIKSQMRFILFVGLIACVFLGYMCYSTTSITGFLVYVVLAVLFLYGLWRFNKRVENNEEIKNTQKQLLPAEELFLSENDIVWEIKKLNPEKTTIAWESVVAYKEGKIEYEVNGRIKKIEAPRVVLVNNNAFIEYIEKYTKLKKVIKERYVSGEIVEVAYYEK